MASAEIVKEYDVLFAIRTGITILLPKIHALDCSTDVPVQFQISPDNGSDLVITAADKSAILKDFKKELIAEAVKRGVIMFYEMKDEEVVRCTPCNHKKK